MEGSRTRRSVIAGVLGVAACAPARQHPAMVNLASVGPSTDGGTASTVLETAFDAAVRMTVPVTLDGLGPFPFVVDTGANISVVSDQLAARISLPLLGTAEVHGIVGAQQAPMTRIRRLEVGDVATQLNRMAVLPQHQLGAEGLVGVDVLRGRRLTLNYARKRLEIARSSPVDYVSASRLRDTGGENGPAFVAPARFRSGQLVIVDAESKGVKVIAFIDSGSQVTVGNQALKSAVSSRDRNFAARMISAPLISATGQTMMAEIAALPPLRLGGLRMSYMTTAFADLHIFKLWDLQDQPAVLIGVDTLRYFRSVTIDYGQKKVIFRPPVDGVVIAPG